MTQKRQIAIFFGIALATLAAEPAAVRAAGQTSPVAASPSAISPRAASPREVTDETGRRVSVPEPVRRVVSLAPDLTETIYALGAQDELAGVTDYCDFPPEARAKPRIGAPVSPSLEGILALKPDLVLATRSINRRESVDELERLGVAVYATDPRTVDGVLASITHIAALLGMESSGDALVARLEGQLDDLRRRLAGRPSPRVLFVVWEEPLITIGQHTFLADALRRAGAESVVHAKKDWPQLSLEEVVRLQPEFLVFVSNHAETGAQEAADLRTRPVWKELEAVKHGRIVVTSDAIIRPAPRLVDAIVEVARQLHPDAFEEKQEDGIQKNENRQAAGISPHSLFSVFHFLSSSVLP